jgi:8-oxo-dGTP pyrophosphatase MutT (NUDIX family)
LTPAPGLAGAQVCWPAATVLLLRESEGQLEVLLTKRAAGLSFMAGLWVFPGGRLEPEDRSPALVEHVQLAAFEPVRRRMLDVTGRPISLADALALHVAACRETFEESGVLLARPRTGGDSCDPLALTRAAATRAADATAAQFAALIRAEGLQLQVDRLVYWSHWITPSVEPKRFDTRFFAIPVPEGQVASVDLAELTHHAWLGEQDVAAHTASGEMRMAPPTLATLHDLWTSHRRHGSLAAMIDGERGRQVPPILPKLVRASAGTVEAVLPWDEEYVRLPGDGCVGVVACPAYLRDLPTRRRFRA